MLRRLCFYVGCALLIFVSALKISEWIIEKWWFESLGYGSIYARYTLWRASSFVFVFGAWWLVLGRNLSLAWYNGLSSHAPIPLLGGGSRIISLEKKVVIDQNRQRLTTFFVILAALLGGAAASNHFDTWVLALNADNWVSAPTSNFTTIAGLGFDLSFYGYALPALHSAWNFLGVLLFTTFIGCVGIYLYEETIEAVGRHFHITREASAHLNVLGSSLILWIGGRAILSGIEIPIVSGWSANAIYGPAEASFAVPIQNFFAFSSVVVAALLLANTFKWQRPFVWPLVWGWVLGAWLLPPMAAPFGRALGGSAKDTTAQRLAIANHIDATLSAWGLNQVRNRRLALVSSEFVSQPTNSKVGNLAGILGDENLWPRDSLVSLLDSQTGDSERHVSEVFPLERNGKIYWRGIAQNSASRHGTPGELLEYEGNSGLLSPTEQENAIHFVRRVRSFDSLLLSSVPPLEPSPGFSPVGPNTEVSTDSTLRVRTRLWRTSTQSAAAVPRNSWTVLPLALRFLSPELLRLGPPVSWHLSPLERAEVLAPFVDWDGAVAQPVVAEEAQPRLLWATIGCFTSRTIPVSASIPLSGSWHGVNYARQGVLALSDAESGATSFYLLDDSEPLSKAWNQLLPGFFQSKEKIPASVRGQILPSDAFLTAQATIWERYHGGVVAGKEGMAQLVSNWVIGREDEWLTPSFDSTERDQYWQTVPGGRMLCAFSQPARQIGQPEQINAFLGVERDCWWNNNATPTSWVAVKAIELPKFMEGNSPNPYGLYKVAANARRTVLEPHFDKDENIIGLTVSQGEVKQPDNAGKQAWASLEVERAISLPASITPTSDATLRLTEARILWTQILQARRANNWALVEKLEAKLSTLLGS